MSTPDRLTDEERIEAWLDDDADLRIPDTAWGRALYDSLRTVLAARLAAQPPATDRDALAEQVGVSVWGYTPEHIAALRDINPDWQPLIGHEREIFDATYDALAACPAPDTTLRRDVEEREAAGAQRFAPPSHGSQVPRWETEAEEVARNLAEKAAPDTLADRVQALADRLDAAPPSNFDFINRERRRLSADLRALLAGRSDASPEEEGGPLRCPYVSTDPYVLYRGDRDDGWRCGREKGHDGAHRLYSADGEHVIYSASWERRADASPEGGEQRG